MDRVCNNCEDELGNDQQAQASGFCSGSCARSYAGIIEPEPERKTQAEIDQEKFGKPRPDLLPACAILGAGKVMGYGFRKHGNCTWRIAGTEQADPQTHYASALRHLLEYGDNPNAIEEGSGLPVLYHALSQIAILIDCIDNPAAHDSTLILSLAATQISPDPFDAGSF